MGQNFDIEQFITLFWINLFLTLLIWNKLINSFYLSSESYFARRRRRTALITLLKVKPESIWLGQFAGHPLSQIVQYIFEHFLYSIWRTEELKKFLDEKQKIFKKKQSKSSCLLKKAFGTFRLLQVENCLFSQMVIAILNRNWLTYHERILSAVAMPEKDRPTMDSTTTTTRFLHERESNPNSSQSHDVSRVDEQIDLFPVQGYSGIKTSEKPGVCSDSMILFILRNNFWLNPVPAPNF